MTMYRSTRMSTRELRRALGTILVVIGVIFALVGIWANALVGISVEIGTAFGATTFIFILGGVIFLVAAA